MSLDLSEHKRRVAAVYNLAAPGYDKPAVRFFRLCAERLVGLAGVLHAQRVLDIATGTGVAALAAARAVGPTGQVVGVDIAADMLAQAQRKVDEAHLTNVELREEDAERLTFGDDSFDVVLSASSIFFLPDMLASLREWVRVAKPAGTVAFQGYGGTAFEPISTLYETRIRGYGVTLAAPTRPFSWQRLIEPGRYRALLAESGCEAIDVREEQLGYHLHSAEEWWDIVWNSGFRGPVAQLPAEDLARFKVEHLAEVAQLATEQGIWLDIPAIFAVGRKPAPRG